MAAQTSWDENQHPRGDGGQFAPKAPAPEESVALDDMAMAAHIDDMDDYLARIESQYVPDDTPVRIGRLGLRPGQSLEVGENEHGDPDLETVTISRDDEGRYWAEGGPTVYFGEAVPDEARGDEDSYLNRNFHRVQSHVSQTYGARVELYDGDDAVEGRVLFRTELDPDSDTFQMCESIHDRTRLGDLVSDTLPRDADRTRFDDGLRQRFEADDQAARTPREVVAPAGAAYTQAQLDHAVATARESIATQNQVVKAEHRKGYVITEYTHPRGERSLHVYQAGAWEPPAQEPVLPWSPPAGRRIATVDLDGHADMIEEEHDDPVR